MLKTLFCALVALLLAVPAHAEQQNSPEFLQKALAVVQAQRNQALDAAAVAEVRAATLTEDLNKAQARIKELEPKPEEKR